MYFLDFSFKLKQPNLLIYLFLKVLNQYKKPAVKSPVRDEKKMSEFIVDTDECTTSSSTESDERRSIFLKKPATGKKGSKTKSNSNYKRIIKPIFSSSSSSDSDKNGQKDENNDDDDESSDDSDLYGKDLQLFYIRMNNREEKEATAKKL